MSEISIEQLRRDLDIALKGVTDLANGFLKQTARLNAQSTNISNLVFRLETARGESFIYGKVVAQILGDMVVAKPTVAV